MKLDIGCGPNVRAGYEGVDIRPLPGVRFNCNALDLPNIIQPGSVEAIYSRHFLEHLTEAEGRRFLGICYALLQEGGLLEVIVPDLYYHAGNLIDAPELPSDYHPQVSNQQHALAAFYGWQRDATDVHRWGYIEETLRAALQQAGFVYIELDRSLDLWHLGLTAFRQRTHDGRALDSGERQTATTLAGIREDHQARYALASTLCEGMRVLDCACGNGYGSAMLIGAGALAVLGIDISEEAIACARNHYQRPDIEYHCGDANEDNYLRRYWHERVVCLETLEHVAAPARLLRRFHEQTTDDGLLIVSLPNSNHSNAAGNRYHLRHYTPEEFADLLTTNGWEIQERFGQQGQQPALLPDQWDCTTMIAVCRKV